MLRQQGNSICKHTVNLFVLNRKLAITLVRIGALAEKHNVAAAAMICISRLGLRARATDYMQAGRWIIPA